MLIIGLAAATLTVVALLEFVPGMGSLWIEAAAPMLITYLGGCLVGAVARSLAARLSAAPRSTIPS